MSTLTTTADAPVGTASTARRSRPAPAPIPFSRLVAVELRKAFDTRAGFWLLAAVGITATLATLAAAVWAPEEALTYGTFASAVGIPMSVVLPIIAILSVTSEWSQRTGLTTFTLVPRRGRSVAAKAVVALAVGLGSMLVALAVGAVGALGGPLARGLDPVWDVDVATFALVVLAQVLGMALGFMLGVLLRTSAAAIVGYFVVAFVLPTLTQLLALAQEWFADARGWVDFGFTQSKLWEGGNLSGQEWSQLAATTSLWIMLPTVFGLWRLLRSEIK